MAMPTKSPVREAIEAEVIACLTQFDRPLSADEIYHRTETADDKHQVVRIIGHMREAGMLIRADDIPVGEPGGMSPKTKGARAVASYRLPTEADRAQIDAAATAEAYNALDDALHRSDPSAVGQGKSAEAVAALDLARAQDPIDDLDTAASSTNGDESASPWSRILAEGCHEDHQWESDLLQACETSRESLLTIADQLLAGHPVWSAARAVDRALTRLADDYV